MTCDKETIVKYEREWMSALCADLNTIFPIITEKEKEKNKKEYDFNYYRLRKREYSCNVCDKFFDRNSALQKHLKSLKHQYAYLNSVD